MDALDNALGIRAIGRFMHNHFKFIFCVALILIVAYHIDHKLESHHEIIKKEYEYNKFRTNLRFDEINSNIKNKR
jgi:hypothetical protein